LCGELWAVAVAEEVRLDRWVQAIKSLQ